MMQIISVNVGLPRDVDWKGKRVSTGIFKQPVAGRVIARTLNLDGDRQADLSVHGGPDKAVYAYAIEETRLWEEELGRELGPGAFGENLTLDGIEMGSLAAGDRLAIGDALVIEITKHAQPCQTIAHWFKRRRIARISATIHPEDARWYARVVREGRVREGDPVQRVDAAD